MSLKDLPLNEKPREKLIRYGVESLSNVELLTIVIGSGTKNNSAMDVAYNLIKNKGLLSIANSSYEEYMKINGIKKAKALMLAAIFELYRRIGQLENDQQDDEITSESIYKLHRLEMEGLKQETLGIIILNKRRKLIAEKILYKGTKNYVKTSVRDVLQFLLQKDGKYFYIYHKHPGGSLEPSDNDILFTRSLITEVKKYDFFLLDHIIFGEGGYFSFASGDSHLISQ